MVRPSCALAACCLLACVAPRALGQQYPFLSVAGSPKNAKALFQDSRGRLWIGGDQLHCFDGTRFFSLRDYGFPSAEATTITEDSSGAIWIGAETGVYRFFNGSVEEVAQGVAVSVIPATPDIVVAAMGPLGKGVPTNASLIRLRREGRGWRSETVMSLDSPGPLTLDASGNVLYPFNLNAWREMRLQEVIQWQPGGKLAFTHHGQARGNPLNGAWQVMRDHFGCIWFAAPGALAYDCGSGKGSTLVSSTRLHAPMHEALNGDMVLRGDNELLVGRPGSFHVATRANGLPGLLDAIPSRDGSIWLGTANGIYRFPSPFHTEYWTIREGLADPPWAFARIGDRIFSGLDHQIVVLGEDRQRWDTIAKFEPTATITSLISAGDGTLLASFVAGGAVQLRTDGKVLAHTAKDHPRGGAMRLARTPDGEIWLGADSLGRIWPAGGILQFEEHPLRAKPVGNILAIKYEEHTRKLWSCYNGGLVVRDDQGKWSEFNTGDGLQVDGCWSLAPMPNGDVWYAYYNAPAFALIRPRADGTISVRQYADKDGVPQPPNDTFDVDKSERLWRSGELGIYVANPSQAEAGRWLKLDESEGFPASDMNTGSVFVDSDGSLWWGADNDLAHYVPASDLVTPQTAPQIYVSAFSWENQAARLADAVSGLPHGSKIMAHIGSLQFDRRSALHLRYRLTPDQTAWRETESLDLTLGNLSPGPHTLEVQGRVFTGPWSAVIRWPIAVLRPVWMAWPLLTAYFAIALGAAGAGFLRYRDRKAEAAQVLPDLAGWRIAALVPDAHDVAGTLLDSRFEVGTLLARGGFASVMAGFDRSQGQVCAIKIFRNEVRDKGWVQRSFDQEVAALKKVRHPNVVSIYAHGRTPSDAPYLVMEFVEGQNLRDVLGDGALPPARAGRLLDQMSGALDAIHAQGIWHRDVKPENVIVRSAGSPAEEAVLIDFSIAIVKDANETLHGLSRAAGSFDYMAPEQAIGYAQASSDIYSLAKLLIEMLTGRQLKDLLPHASMDLPDRVREMAEHLDLNLSRDSIATLASALEFDPARRPSAASSFAKPLVRDLQSSRTNGAF